jgi:hypothetical protein
MLFTAATRLAFAVYRLAVLALGAAITGAEARGLIVALMPDAGSAQQFSGYPIPRDIVVSRPLRHMPSR